MVDTLLVGFIQQRRNKSENISCVEPTTNQSLTHSFIDTEILNDYTRMKVLTKLTDRMSLKLTLLIFEFLICESEFLKCKSEFRLSSDYNREEVPPPAEKENFLISTKLDILDVQVRYRICHLK